MKKTIFVLLSLFFVQNSKAIEPTAELFYFDEDKVQMAFAELEKLNQFLEENPTIEFTELLTRYPDVFKCNIENVGNPLDVSLIAAPGRIPSFWFTFTLSAVGTYFIYGAVAGPIAVAIVYFNTDKDKKETKKAIWGCVTGTLIGAGIKYALMNL